MGTLLDDWNDLKARKMRELYAEQDHKQRAMDGDADAAEIAALRAENALLREKVASLEAALTEARESTGLPTSIQEALNSGDGTYRP